MVYLEVISHIQLGLYDNVNMLQSSSKPIHWNWWSGLDKLQNIFNITEEVQLRVTSYYYYLFP